MLRPGAVSHSEVTAVSAIAGSWVGIWSWAAMELRTGGGGGAVLGGEAGAGCAAGTISMGMTVAMGSVRVAGNPEGTSNSNQNI